MVRRGVIAALTVGLVLSSADRARAQEPAEDDSTPAQEPLREQASPEPEPPPEPRSPEPPPEPSPPAHVSPPEPAPPPAIPSRELARSGTVLLSVDDAFPLLSMGAGAPLDAGSALRLGDASYAMRTSPKLWALDVAVADNVTFGGTTFVQHSHYGTIAGAAFRAGFVAPLASRVALWPRLGISHTGVTDERSRYDLASRTDITVDARLAFIASPAWALTLGPTVAIPIQSGDGEPQAYDPFSAALTPRDPVAPRVGLAVGIAGRLSSTDDASAGPSQPPRFYLSIERVVPFLRYREEVENISGHGRTPRADVGTADVHPLTPQAPRLAFDARVGRNFTLGLAASVGYVRVSQTSSLVPRAGSPESFAFAVAPRAGIRVEVTRSFMFWPRAGLTYVGSYNDRADHGTYRSWHLGADLDLFGVLFPVPGFGVVFGPSVEYPLAGATPEFSEGRTPLPGDRVITVAFTAGLVVEIP